MVRLLDITVATLTLDQQRRLARAAAADHTARAEARSRAIRELGHGDHARWVVNRWIRWTDLFALPAPISGLAWVADQVAAPFAALDAADDRVAGALALFDAALGLAATPDTAQGHADRAMLTAVWERVCLPASRTQTDVYGPRTPEVARYLTDASACGSQSSWLTEYWVSIAGASMASRCTTSGPKSTSARLDPSSDRSAIDTASTALVTVFDDSNDRTRFSTCLRRPHAFTSLVVTFPVSIKLRLLFSLLHGLHMGPRLLAACSSNCSRVAEVKCSRSSSSRASGLTVCGMTWSISTSAKSFGARHQ
jgi:hypothetical protein